MDFSVAEINGLLGDYLWPFFRIAAMIMVAPIFSSTFISNQIKLIIAIALSIIIVPNIPSAGLAVEPLSASGLLIIAQQILIGACIGFLLQLLINAFLIAGQIIAMQMGLGFASMVDPQNGVTVPVVSQLYLITITLLFLSLNGHLVLIQVLVESFTTLPVAATGLTPFDFRDIVSLASWMYAAAVIIALPAIGSLMMVNLSFGILSRAAPQISPFTIGFPLTIVLGFVVMIVTLSSTAQHMTEMSSYMLNMARGLVSG